MHERNPVTHRGCFEPFVHCVRKKFEEGGSIGDALKFTKRAVRHDQSSTFSLNIGKLFKKPALDTLEITSKHSLVFNTLTLTGICIYEWSRSRGLPLPSSELVLGPVVAAGASISASSNEINIGNGAILGIKKDGTSVIRFTRSEDHPVIAKGLDEQETQELLKRLKSQ